MRILKPVVAIAVIAITIGVILWQSGVINFDDQSNTDVNNPYATSPEDVRMIAALRVAAEIQRLKEILGEADMGYRMQMMRERAKTFNAGVSADAFDTLRKQRAALADRLFSTAEAAIATPNWPAGDAAVHEATAREFLSASRIDYAEAVASDTAVGESLEHAVTALVLARGQLNPIPAFLLLSGDIEHSLEGLPAPNIQAPLRGTSPPPPTALTPLGN